MEGILSRYTYWLAQLGKDQTEANELSQDELTEQASQRIYDDIAEQYGSNSDYSNDYDRGMDID